MSILRYVNLCLTLFRLSDAEDLSVKLEAGLRQYVDNDPQVLKQVN